MQRSLEFRQTKRLMLTSRMKCLLKETQSWIPILPAPLDVSAKTSSLQIVKRNPKFHLSAYELSSALADNKLKTATG
jgi:hypothetical protein